jgi:hypothetical protein
MKLTGVYGWLAFCSLIAAQAQPATTTTRALAASATFAYPSDDGCVENDVIVFANQTTVASAKTPGATAEVMYYRHRYDYCADADLGTDQGTSRRPVFSGDLNRAALTAAISGTSASGSAVSASFELVWEGKGAITPTPKTASGSTKMVRDESLTRNAVLSGTIDGQSVSSALVSANLHSTRRTISR